MSSAHKNYLLQLAELHGRKFSHCYSWHQPYTTCIPSLHKNQSQLDIRPPSALMDKIKYTQEAAVDKTTQRKDAS